MGGMQSTVESDACLDTEPLPDEAVAFVNDQLPDQLNERGQALMGRALAHSWVDVAPDDDVIKFHRNPIASLVGELFQEKLTDMRREIQRGDRSDYTVTDIDRFQTHVTEEL